MTEWVTRGGSAAQTAGLIVGLLATDVLLPIPASLVSTLGGARLGWAGGTAASWAGMSLGAVLGFAWLRYGGRPVAERLAGPEELQRIEQLSRRYGPSVLVVTRALPVFAEASVLLVGIERLAWRRFLPPVSAEQPGHCTRLFGIRRFRRRTSVAAAGPRHFAGVAAAPGDVRPPLSGTPRRGGTRVGCAKLLSLALLTPLHGVCASSHSKCSVCPGLERDRITLVPVHATMSSFAPRKQLPFAERKATRTRCCSWTGT